MKWMMAIILALLFGMNMAPCIRAEQEQTDVFAQIRQRRKDILIGEKGRDMADLRIRKIVEETTVQAQEYWNSMTFSDEKIWPDLEILTGTLYGCHTAYNRMNTMAQAYCMEESNLYHKEEILAAIIKGMNFIADNRLPIEERKEEDWWYREIGVPIQFNDLCILLYDVLPKDRLLGKKKTGLNKHKKYTVR